MPDFFRNAALRLKGNPVLELLPRRFPLSIPNINRLGPGALALDCGANVGEITSALARTGCDVVAFEPNPYCVEFLNNRFRYRKNVTVIAKAVSDNNGEQKLFFHKDIDGIAGSEASSLEAEKGNLDNEKCAIVKTEVLSEFLKKIDRPVNLLKIDVEGHEDIVLRDLILSQSFDRIDFAIVEVHDEKYDFMKPRIIDLKRLIRETGLEEKIDLTWH